MWPNLKWKWNGKKADALKGKWRDFAVTNQISLGEFGAWLSLDRRATGRGVYVQIFLSSNME